MSEIKDVPENRSTLPTVSAASSPALLALKEDLLARGMSDDDAEEFLQMI